MTVTEPEKAAPACAGDGLQNERISGRLIKNSNHKTAAIQAVRRIAVAVFAALITGAPQ